MTFRYRELGKLIESQSGHNLQLRVPLPKSEEGLCTLRCPKEDCQPRAFQLGTREFPATDMNLARARRPPGEPAVTCPYCGHDDEQSEFFHPDDIDAAVKRVEWAAMQDLTSHFRDLTKGFNQRVGGGLFSVTMDVQPSRVPQPFFYRQDLLRHLTCDGCHCQYGVYAIGLFCPDCGAPNLHVHFDREVALIHAQIELAKTVEAEQGKELSYRVLGNAHEDVVTALETYLKTVYRFIIERRFPKDEAVVLLSKVGNAFQNIERGATLFAKVGIEPYSHLDPSELTALRINLEKRHVLGHNLGLVDSKYARFVENEKIGENVRLVADDVRAFADIARLVVIRFEEQREFGASATSAGICVNFRA